MALSPPKNNRLKNKNQLDAIYRFIILIIGSICFGHCYAHHQELTTIILITKLVISFLVCCRLEVRCRHAGQMSGLQTIARTIACSPDTYPACLHLTSNQQQPKNQTAHVVISTIVVSSWWWTQKCPKRVEHVICIIKHEVASRWFLFFSYRLQKSVRVK